ncbi:hypothetical protein SCUCBS95973_007755 [Sporothrix curviconia]|uniref:Aminoglycoside phosphotransferase domain-containing protein n=1 Tax=Sporothrix curviconia TaxID=1260050 RepID=A0ABP0CIS1_9PEZI
MDYEEGEYDIEAEHVGYEELAINDTRLTRAFVRVALNTSARLFSPGQVPGIPISRHWMVKRDRYGHLTEAKTLQYLAAYTRVPVPVVCASFVRKGAAYIVMERPRGITLAQAYWTYSREDLLTIFAQLRSIIDNMRAIPIPRDTVMGVYSCVGGTIPSHRQHYNAPRCGPFETVEDFHWWIRDHFHPDIVDRPPWINEEDWADMEGVVDIQEAVSPRPVFTHGNLKPWNIIVSGTKVTSIIGWENAGWFPEYWEYTTACMGGNKGSRWKYELPYFLDPYMEELQMELVRLKHWRQF